MSAVSHPEGSTSLKAHGDGRAWDLALQHAPMGTGLIDRASWAHFWQGALVTGSSQGRALKSCWVALAHEWV